MHSDTLQYKLTGWLTLFNAISGLANIILGYALIFSSHITSLGSTIIGTLLVFLGALVVFSVHLTARQHYFKTHTEYTVADANLVLPTHKSNNK